MDGGGAVSGPQGIGPVLSGRRGGGGEKKSTTEKVGLAERLLP